MKTNANKATNTIQADQLNELENDAVWTLLDEAEKTSPVEASPMFARNVLREIRLQDPPVPVPVSVSLWQRIFTPRVNKITLSLCATAACAALVITMLPKQNTAPDSLTTEDNLIEGIENISLEELSTLSITTEEDDFTGEMLELANQDPFFISEEEIEVAMQM